MRGRQLCAEQAKWPSRQKDHSARQPEGKKELTCSKGQKKASSSTTEIEWGTGASAVVLAMQSSEVKVWSLDCILWVMVLSLNLSYCGCSLLFTVQTTLLLICSSEFFVFPSCQIPVMVLADASLMTAFSIQASLSHVNVLFGHQVPCVEPGFFPFPSPGFCLECLLYPLLPVMEYQAHVLPDLRPLSDQGRTKPLL